MLVPGVNNTAANLPVLIDLRCHTSSVWPTTVAQVQKVSSAIHYTCSPWNEHAPWEFANPPDHGGWRCDRCSNTICPWRARTIQLRRAGPEANANTPVICECNSRMT